MAKHGHGKVCNMILGKTAYPRAPNMANHGHGKVCLLKLGKAAYS